MQDQRQTQTKIYQEQTYNWRDEALCANLEVSVFFPDLRGMNVDKYIEQNLPCVKCTVKEECLDYADDNGEEWGIWGGEYRTPKILSKRQVFG